MRFLCKSDKSWILLQKNFIHWYLYKPCIWLTLTMQSITEPLPHTLVLRKIIIYNFLFSVQGPRLLKYIPKSHNFSMWKWDKQDNETCKKNKKKNSLSIYKHQKIALNVPKGIPRMICAIHTGKRDPVVEIETQLPFVP